MIRALYTAASGMMVESRKMDLLAHNLGNVQTPGFRSSGLVRREVPTGGTATDVQTAQAEHFLDPSSGPLRTTGRPLDLAVDGEGFFAVETQGGVAYTRNGGFALRADGLLVDRSGNPVLGEAGPVRVPGPGEVQVGSDGTLRVEGRRVDRLRLETFQDAQALRPAGASLYYPVAGARAVPADNGRVVQGALEGSNLDGVAGMTRMVETLRAFEAYQKAIQTVDEATSQAVRLGRVA